MNNLQPAQLTATLPESYRGIILNTLNRNREDILSAVQGFVDSIPAPSMAPGHTARRDSVDRFLADRASTLIRLTTRAGMGQEAVTAFMGTLRSHLRAFIVTAGDINEQYPHLLPALTIIIVSLLVPELSILRLLGFGPAGPVAGTAAPAMQSSFGGAVSAGSWFAQLQSAGMGGAIPAWFSLATKGVLGGLGTATYSLFKFATGS